MKTVNEVSVLTGVSIRTLQYYDNEEKSRGRNAGVQKAIAADCC